MNSEERMKLIREGKYLDHNGNLLPREEIRELLKDETTDEVKLYYDGKHKE